MNEKSEHDAIDNQPLTETEKWILQLIRENPELRFQMAALRDEINPVDHRPTLDEMESHLIDRLRVIGREVLRQAARSQETELCDEARSKHIGARQDRKKNSHGSAPSEPSKSRKPFSD